MQAPICSIHNIVMTYKESGVSKTGRRYPAFWGCPDRTDGEFCKKTIPADEWSKQVAESPTEAFERSLKEEPVQSVEVEEPMKKKDWNFKTFEQGLRALTVEFRKDDMSPVQVWETTHTKDWMYALYGDEEGYPEWLKAYEVRLTELE